MLAEINNLKTIIGRFSEFSKMPQPQRQADANQRRGALGAARLSCPIAGEEPHCRAAPNWPRPLPEISADPDLLHRALQNLVLNAIDAMPQGGELTIRTAAIAPTELQFRVSDTGSGLTPEECERLFTPYYTTKQHGTGLGLAIVQSVVSDHGGKISVASTKEKGTTFRIELPCDFSAHSASLR